MKLIGLLSLFVGGVFLAIYVGAWVALISECGPAEAVRRGFTLWPGNVIQVAILALVIVLSAGGFSLLTSRK
jgi:hypothetical protein